MERHCPACGARVSDDMKICANCGKIIPPKGANRGRNTVQGQQRAVRQAQGSVTASRKQQVQQRPRVSQKSQTVQRPKPQKKRNSRVISRFNLKKWLKAGLVILAIYLIISVIQVFRVRFSTYEFKSTDMKMSMDNYGQAIDGFFDSGRWVYNPFTLTVSYSGETVEGDEYKLKFKASSSVELKGIEVDGEEKAETQFETVIMGMFI